MKRLDNNTMLHVRFAGEGTEMQRWTLLFRHLRDEHRHDWGEYDPGKQGLSSFVDAHYKHHAEGEAS